MCVLCLECAQREIVVGHGHTHGMRSDGVVSDEGRAWARARKHAVAQILEMGIALHRSVFIGDDMRLYSSPLAS